MSAETPRAAGYDDLRVGQVIAWVENLPQPTARGGEVVDLGNGWVSVADGCRLTRAQTAGTGRCLTILRDAPEPPVKVRREDFYALVRAYSKHVRNFDAPTGLFAATSDLIDNAVDAGDDQ